RRNRAALSPRATFRLGEWSVSTRYSWPSSTAASAISSIGEPPSDQFEWQWQSPRSAPPQLGRGLVQRYLGIDQPPQVGRLLPGQRLGYAPGGHVPQSGQLRQGAG